MKRVWFSLYLCFESLAFVLHDCETNMVTLFCSDDRYMYNCSILLYKIYSPFFFKIKFYC